MIKFEGDKVWVSIGATINLGNYESIKVDSGLALDRLENETLDEAKARVLVEALDFSQNAINMAVSTIKFPEK